MQSGETKSHSARAAAGWHLIIDVMDGAGLDDPARIEAALRDAVRASGARLLHLHLHRFSPHGVTGVALLAESHITVHTWPEWGYAAFDIFMCGDTEPEAAIPVLSRAFQTDQIKVRTLHRGADGQ